MVEDILGFVTSTRTKNEPIKSLKSEKDAYNNKQVTKSKICNTLVYCYFFADIVSCYHSKLKRGLLRFSFLQRQQCEGLGSWERATSTAPRFLFITCPTPVPVRT